MPISHVVLGISVSELLESKFLAKSSGNFDNPCAGGRLRFAPLPKRPCVCASQSPQRAGCSRRSSWPAVAQKMSAMTSGGSTTAVRSTCFAAA